MPSCRQAPSSTRPAMWRADGLFDGADLRRLQLDDVLLALDDEVDLADVDERVAVGARHLRVDLRDDRLGDLRGRLGVVDRDAERAEAVLVGRRDLDQHDVGRQVALAEQLGDLVEEDGDVVAAAVLDGLARAGADEQRLVEERVGVLGLRVLALAHGDHVVDLDVLELARARRRARRPARAARRRRGRTPRGRPTSRTSAPRRP